MGDLEDGLTQEEFAIRIAVLGATGFIGRAVSLTLRSAGHKVVACVRSKERGRRMLGGDADVFEAPSGVPGPELLSGCDAVVNFAGSPLVGRRWSRQRLAEAEESRVVATEKLVGALCEASPRPRVLVSASATGYYGGLPGGRPAGSAPAEDPAPATESTPPGKEYLAGLCRRWEEAALRAESCGVRVVPARTGVVLGRFGGVLEVMEPVFRAGLGGRLSTGEQWFSWIHIDDLCRAVAEIVENETLGGPVNLVAPEPVGYRDFVDSLASVLGVRAPWSIPAPLIRVVLGEGASPLLAGRAVVPEKLTETGFEFLFADIESALADLFEPASIVVSEGPTLGDVFDDERVRDRGHRGDRAGLLLQSAVSVTAPPEIVFDFYSIPANLAVYIPPRIPFRVVDAPERAYEGTLVTYETGRPPLTRRYRGEIFGISEQEEFFDRSFGPAPFEWFHRHRFLENGRGGTAILDDVWVGSPLFPGAKGISKAMLRMLFEYRNLVTGFRFGSVHERRLVQQS